MVVGDPISREDLIFQDIIFGVFHVEHTTKSLLPSSVVLHNYMK